jgi:hypothetical protein
MVAASKEVLMRWAHIFLVVTILIPHRLHAQSRQYTDVPRYELGVEANINYLDGVGEWGGGIGGRFHYNFDQHFALDSELTYRQHELLVLAGPSVATAVVGQTSGLFGIRAGQRDGDYGFFAEARAGFLHFSNNNGVSLLTRNTVPAFDVGGSFERYLGPVILRFGLSELIVPYGDAKLPPPSPSITPPQPQPGPLGTRASPMVSFGFAVRF